MTSNLKMALLAFLKLHLLFMDYVLGVDGRWNAVYVWSNLLDNAPGPVQDMV